MMLVFKKRALNTINKTAAWVEDNNTEGSGDRWLNKIFHSIDSFAQTTNLAQYKLCPNEKLSRWNYHCLSVEKKWIVAFKVETNVFVVYRFIHGSRLK
jgi:hypothetical protein